jgi:hypothetical protein
MSPPRSKSLIWSHEPITSSPEIAAIGNFHQLPDATLVCETLHTSDFFAGEPGSVLHPRAVGSGDRLPPY